MKVIAVSQLFRCDHQCISSINTFLVKNAALSVVSKCQPELLPSIPFLSENIYFQGRKKKKNKITLRWRFVCIWTHVESKFFACKGACLICSLHRAEQHFLVLGSGPVKGEINSSTSLHKWSGKKWVPCLCLDYTLHVHQRHK